MNGLLSYGNRIKPFTIGTEVNNEKNYGLSKKCKTVSTKFVTKPVVKLIKMKPRSIRVNAQSKRVNL